MGYIVGVEGGGSHIQILVIEVKTNKIIQNKIYQKCTNRYVLGLEKALQIMNECILETLKESKLDISKVSHVGITASGFNTQDPEIFKFFESQKYPKVSICQDTDGPAICYLKEKKSPCAVVISGTGQASKVFMNENINLILEGFGHALNECGCAYTCSRLFVNRVIRQFDMGDQTNKPAYELFAKEMGISADYRSDDLLTLFYGQNKQKIASFAKVMCENVSKYEIFMKIFQQSLEELAEVISITYGAYHRLIKQNNIKNAPQRVPMLKVGGFWNFAKNPKLLEVLKNSLKKWNIDMDKNILLLDCPPEAPSVGAALVGQTGDFSGLSIFSTH